MGEKLNVIQGCGFLKSLMDLYENGSVLSITAYDLTLYLRMIVPPFPATCASKAGMENGHASRTPRKRLLTVHKHRETLKGFAYKDGETHCRGAAVSHDFVLRRSLTGPRGIGKDAQLRVVSPPSGDPENGCAVAVPFPWSVGHCVVPQARTFAILAERGCASRAPWLRQGQPLTPELTPSCVNKAPDVSNLQRNIGSASAVSPRLTSFGGLTGVTIKALPSTSPWPWCLGVGCLNTIQ